MNQSLAKIHSGFLSKWNLIIKIGMKMNKHTLLLVSLLMTSPYVNAEQAQAKSHDGRYSLGLNAEEKVEFLSEMRQMLTSIQQIMLGIGTGNKEMIINAARYSGNRMARATPQSVKDKTPSSFERIGGPTHMMFEELIVNAEAADETDIEDMKDLAELTGVLMQNCLACHAAFKVE